MCKGLNIKLGFCRLNRPGHRLLPLLQNDYSLL
jgi:hypothetical protein